MLREIDLSQYLPTFISEYKEIKHIMDAENPEFQRLVDEGERLTGNQFIISCDFSGIAKFEELLNITSFPEDTLESRISRVLVRWNDPTLYTWKMFLQKLNSLCGTDFEVITDWEQYRLTIVTHLNLFGQVENLNNLLAFMLPANLISTVNNSLQYEWENSAYSAVGMVICKLIEVREE